MTDFTTPPVNPYTANGSNDDFDYEFLILDDGDIVVTADGVTLDLDVDYTVSGVGEPGGGTVTFIDTPAAGTAIVIYGDTRLVRDTEYQQNGDLLARILNSDFNKLWLKLRDLIYQQSLNVQLPPGDSLAGNLVIPSPIAGYFWRWNGDANAIEFVDIGSAELQTPADQSVTLAKLQNIAQYQIITRTSSGSGVPQLITSSANVLSILQAANFAAVRSLLSLGTAALVDASVLSPPGAVMAFAMSTAPTGWLECDGSAVSRTTYAALFAAIGTTWGVGNGTTTFNLPDLRGEFMRGWDHGRGVDSGRAFASAQSDQNKEHRHDFGSANASSSGSADYGRSSGAGTTFYTSYEGGSEARPRSIAVLYCIKT